MRPGSETIAVTLALALGLFAISCSAPAAPVEARAADIKLVERTFFDGHLKMLVPEHFVPLDETALHARFHLDIADVAVLQNADRKVELAAILEKESVTAASAETNDKFHAQKAVLMRLVGDGIRNAYGAKQCLRDEIVTRDGRPILFLELAFVRIDVDRRIIVAYTNLGDRPLEVTFSCPESRAATWAAIGERMVGSVVVTE